jgi:hypothetical protein
MELLDYARKCLYKLKTFTEEDMSCGLLFLQLGDAHVASLAHQTFGTPSHSILHYQLGVKSTVNLLLSSAEFPTKSEIQHKSLSCFHIVAWKFWLWVCPYD